MTHVACDRCQHRRDVRCLELRAPVIGDVCCICGRVYEQIHVIYTVREQDGSLGQRRKPLEGEVRWCSPSAVAALRRACEEEETETDRDQEADQTSTKGR